MTVTQTPVDAHAPIEHTQLLIGGEFVDALDGKVFDTVNPSTGEVITQVAEGSAADVDRAVAAVKAILIK